MHVCASVCLYASHRSVVGCPPLSSPAPANYLSLQSNAFSKKDRGGGGCFSSVKHLECDSCQDVRPRRSRGGGWIWSRRCCGQLSGENTVICHRQRKLPDITPHVHTHACSSDCWTPRTSSPSVARMTAQTQKVSNCSTWKKMQKGANLHLPHRHA